VCYWKKVCVLWLVVKRAVVLGKSDVLRKLGESAVLTDREWLCFVLSKGTLDNSHR
jgi:hypothetical protein